MEMKITKTLKAFYRIASAPRCFTFSELLDLTGYRVYGNTLKDAFLCDSRFICMDSEPSQKYHFTLDSTLFRLFSNLNIRLAETKVFQLTERQVAFVMNHLRTAGRWHSPPSEAIRWAQSLGLISLCRTSGLYAFPLAKILSHMTPSSIRIVNDVLAEIGRNQIWKYPLDKLVTESIQEGFSMFRKKVAFIVQSREALFAGKRKTLEQLGATFHFTRERIRQLEKEFWVSQRSHRPRKRRPFLSALLFDFISESGSLIFGVNSSRTRLRRFLAKAAGVPIVKLREIGLVTLGMMPEEITLLLSSIRFPEEIDPDAIRNILECQGRIPLVEKDIQSLAESLDLYHQQHLTVVKRAYLALRSIGKPAHYSEIAKVYNSLWPSLASSEHNIHAALSRQQLNVVWIGIHGTYALKDWGYERPSKKLYEAIAEIVQERYKKTGVPVPLTVIRAEIGKYRKAVNPNSLAIATHLNPCLQCISKDTFKPKEPGQENQQDIHLDELDKLLCDLQENA